jgi:glutathione S-transferase
MSGKRIVLYRCPTPTNVLCPCGAVARRLGKLGLDYRTERVPYRRAGRPEIEELTRQDRVPVLLDGEEVIHDSKRILQYLAWKYGKDTQRELERTGDDVAAPRLYNLKRWIPRRRQSS